MEFGDYFQDHHEKCIQISTNMPDIGLEICKTLRIWETKQFCIHDEINGRPCTVLTH